MEAAGPHNEVTVVGWGGWVLVHQEDALSATWDSSCRFCRLRVTLGTPWVKKLPGGRYCPLAPSELDLCPSHDLLFNPLPWLLGAAASQGGRTPWFSPFHLCAEETVRTPNSWTYKTPQMLCLNIKGVNWFPWLCSSFKVNELYITLVLYHCRDENNALRLVTINRCKTDHLFFSALSEVWQKPYFIFKKKSQIYNSQGSVSWQFQNYL